MTKTYHIVIGTILVETSPQAIPLGAACIVSSLRAVFPHEKYANVTAIDLVHVSAEETGPENILAEKILSRCMPGETLIAGFSVYMWNRLSLEKTAAIIRSKKPETILFAGGPEVTAGYDSFLAENRFDCLISGEGERCVQELIRSILDGKPIPRHIRGFPEAAETIPSPWLDGTLDPAEYGGVLWELSRGCPFSCSYCYESKGEKKQRRFPLGRLKKELELFAQKDVPQIFVLDPTFNVDRQRALTILTMIKETLPEAHFVFEIRAELLDAAQAQSFSEISCSLQIGLQSAEPDVLKNAGRNFDKKNFDKKVSLLNDSGAVFGFDLIYGLPGDTLRMFRQSIDYALNLYPNHLELFRLSVLPGTKLADDAPGFGIKHEEKPPYHVLLTPQFSAADLALAEKLAHACNIFYSRGRAVPWFLSVLQPLKLKASQFLADFSDYLETKNYNNDYSLHTEIEKIQLDFLKQKYAAKNLLFLFGAVRDIVLLNGAMARAAGEGEETLLSLSYHPDDLAGYSVLDIPLFIEETCMENCRVRVFMGNGGPDYRLQ